MRNKIHILQTLTAVCFLLVAGKSYSQVTPPVISYVSPQIYIVGTAITPLSPTNTGGVATVDGQTTTFAGNGTAGSTNGTGTAASFNQPLGTAVDAQGNIYVADAGTHLIRKISPSGAVITFAGTGSPGFVNSTIGASASFYHPVGLAVDASGNVYVADEDNNAIRKITPAGAVTTLAGGTQGANDGIGTAAQFYYPCGVAVDASGNVYVADNNNNKIRKITPAGAVTTLAGGTQGANDGTGTAAQFYYPFAITIDASGNLYVADRYNQKIRKVSQAGAVTTIAGTGVAGYAEGAATTTAMFKYPSGIAIDRLGNLYVTDEQNNRIRKIAAGTVSTLAGTGVQGANNGVGNSATFYNPFAVAIDVSGNLFIGEASNNLIRQTLTTPFTISPALPQGLSFNTTTGTISGTPTATSLTTSYSIVAHSAYGTYSTTLMITVNPAGSINLSRDRNYVATFIPRVSGLTNGAQVASSASDKTQVQVDIEYVDGLGRPLQTVNAKASPLGQDIVQPAQYDIYSRETVKFLPYTATSNDGGYKADAMLPSAGVNAFYNPTGGSGPQLPNGIARISFPYSETALESSPLNRPIEKGAPGDAWQLTNKPGATSPGHTAKISYTSNNNILWSTDSLNSRQVALYKVTINANNSRTLTRANNTAVYDTAQLFVTVEKNENWTGGRGGTSEEYKDKGGHVVLKRLYNYKGNALEILSTYYVNDDLGNLVFVLPPSASPDATAPITQATLNNLCYQYFYDERNRNIQKRLPGKGWDFAIYNKLDQPVATQDSVQRNQNNWTITKYDAFGRVILTGIWNNGNVAITRPALQAVLNGINNNFWEAPTSTGNGYSTVAWPSTSITATLTLNFYDTYSNIPGFPSNYLVSSGVSQMLKGLSTVKKTAILNNPTDMLWDVNYYDDLGRTVKKYAQHYLGGSASISTNNYDLTNTTYNFVNDVSTTTRQHWNTSSTTSPKVTITNKNIYDHRSRKLKSWQQITNGSLAADTLKLLYKIDYNEIGQSLTKHVHSIDSINFYQDIAYTYNERGWLLSSTAPLLSLQLQYNTGVKRAFNGNLMYQFWSSTGSTNSFSYAYDVIDRLTSGKSGDNMYIERGISYDKEGNINTLSRIYNNTLIDSLTFNYTLAANPTNQIQSIVDHSADLGSFGYKTGSWTYLYDGNGNTTTDNSKGISIVYNLLNLPQSIASQNTTYTYDASGQKLRRVIGTMASDYIDGIQYDGGVISFIQTEGGRALPNGTTAYNYEYNLVDQLGSSRLTFDSATGKARTEQQDNYLPFGMDISVGTIGSPQNLYLFNKKELQGSTQLYDYGARFYDPVIGRWIRTDGKAELYFATSPYVYALNQPVNAIDPDGHLVLFFNGLWPHNIFGPATSSPEYWRGYTTIESANGLSRQAYKAMDQLIMNQLNDQHAMYFNGQRGSDDGFYREKVGEIDGKNNAKSIIDHLQRDPNHNIVESIKVITHSLGGVYAKGFIKSLKAYIRTLPLAVQQQIKITLVADFDPYGIGDYPADPNIKTIQYRHVDYFNWKIWHFGWLANEIEPGAIQGYIDEDDSGDHDIASFFNDLANLTEGTYVWDSKTKQWVLQKSK